MTDFLKISLLDKQIGCIQTNFSNSITSFEMSKVNDIISDGMIEIANRIKQLGYEVNIKI